MSTLASPHLGDDAKNNAIAVTSGTARDLYARTSLRHKRDQIGPAGSLLGESLASPIEAAQERNAISSESSASEPKSDIISEEQLPTRFPADPATSVHFPGGAADRRVPIIDLTDETDDEAVPRRLLSTRAPRSRAVSCQGSGIKSPADLERRAAPGQIPAPIKKCTPTPKDLVEAIIGSSFAVIDAEYELGLLAKESLQRMLRGDIFIGAVRAAVAEAHAACQREAHVRLGTAARVAARAALIPRQRLGMPIIDHEWSKARRRIDELGNFFSVERSEASDEDGAC